MRRFILIAILAALTGIFQAGFVQALPAPASAIDLPLILVVALVANFRFPEAFTAAAASGATVDVLSSLPFGTNAAIMIVLAAVTVFLFTRVFTNHSWPGTVGINVAAFILANAALAAVRVVRATFAGFPAFGFPDAAAAASAVGAQLAAVLFAIGVAALAKRAFSRFFFFR